MSTKTNFKRIALVAVTALGAGVLSVAPAFAATTDALTNTSAALTAAASGVNTTGVCALGTPTAAATPNTMAVGGTQTVTTTTTGAGILTLTGPATWSSGTNFTLDSTRTVATATDTATLVLNITGVGTVVLSTATVAAPTVALQTFYISAVASCTAGISASNSYVQVTDAAAHVETQAQWSARQTAFNATGAAGGSAANLDTNFDVRTTFAAGATAYIAVRARDAYKVALTGSTNLLVISCDNGAKVNGTALGFYSTSSFAASTTTSNIPVVAATAGVPMSTTCTTSVNGVALTTKKITFVGDIATLTIAPSRNGNYELGTAGRISYVYKDSAGNTLTNTTPTLTTAGTVTSLLTELSDADYYATSTAYVSAQGAGINPAYQTSGYSTFNCINYGSPSITAYKTNAAGVKITSNAIDIRCGGAIDTYTASLNKAAFNAGDVVTLTITGKDAGGGVTAYGATPGTGFSVAMPGMTAVTTPATTDTESAARTGTWVYTYTVNTGSEGAYNGAVKIAVASTSAQYNKPLTVPYTINSTGAVSNADVLKSIVALIASINKQIQALQALILKKK